MLNNPQQRKALVLSLLMVTLAQTAYIGAMQGWSYPTELDEASPQSRSGGLENLFPDLDLRLFVDPSNSSSYSGSGTNLVDLSTYDHNGTIDGATWEAERTRFSFAGSCTVGAVDNFDCDEVNFGETNDHDPAAGGDWSVSAWFNASTIQQSVVVGKLDDGGASVDVGWMIRMNSDGVRVDVGTSSNSSAAWTAYEAISIDRWYHVVLVADKGTSLAMFIDGVEVENISLASSGDLRDTGKGVSIGSYNAGEYNQPFDGQIGAVMAYADALNLTAVNQLYNASKGAYSNTTNLSYATTSSTLILGQAYTLPISVANGTITTSYSLTGTLPSGMNFESSNGTIWGTPTATMTNTTYTVTANNSAGTYSTSLSLGTISSIDLIPSAASSNLTIGQAMTNITFQYNNSMSNSSGSSSSASVSSSSFAYSNNKLSSGKQHSCAILNNGSLKCWGYGSNGELGSGSNSGINAPSSTPINLGTGRTAIAVSAGVYNTCAILDNGSVKCWGNGYYGQLGAGNNTNTNAPFSTPIGLGTGRTAVALAVGENHACAILDNGSLKCWGRDTYGQLGDGGSNTDTNQPSSNPIDLGSGRTAIAVSAGKFHTCAILDNGDLKCWGYDYYGQLGDGGTNTNVNAPSSTPINLGTGRTADAIFARDYYTCAILDNGDLKCWGFGFYGQLGIGSNSNRAAPSSTPIDLGAGRTAVAMAGGDRHVCAILDNGTAKCWGTGASGRLGVGNTTDTNAPYSNPISLGTGRTAVAISAGFFHTCAILDDGTSKCWGEDTWGQLGDGGTNTAQTSPVLVAGNNPWNTTTGLISAFANVTGANACTVSPSLPAGLSIDSSTCTISGTPTALSTSTTYTVTANHSTWQGVGNFTLAVNDEAPDISYSPDWFVLTNNTAMSATTPTNSGGAIPSAFFGYTGDAKATSIAVDSYGHKHVSYRDSSGLRYATDASGSWVTVTVDTASVWSSSIAIDSNDVLHLSYYDDNSADLKYATCSSSCTTASNWNKVSVDTTGLVGYYSSMAIDSNDVLHISYFDDTNKDLKYATCSSGCTTASNWNIVSIDTSSAVGYYTSIAIDSNDALHISYFDNTNTDLKYATCSSSCTTASNWNAVSVDSFGSSVFNQEVRTDIAIDSNDGVHISYFDNTNDDLKYATCSSGCTTASNWNKVSVDTTGDVGYSASIGIDSNDGLHISYSDKTNNNLKYATCSNACTTASNWNNETVDSSTTLTGEYTSLAIDANDFIHISYFDDSTNKIRYLALDSSSNILGYSVSPDLPTGLRLDPMNGKISGTPTELSTNTTYTITVRNSGGVNTTTITIVVNDQVPNALGYTPENMTLEKGTTMTTNTPSVSGGAVTSWEISPSLPSGLSFGSTNGSIWGTPTSLMTLKTFTIWANNSGGSSSATVNITVNDEAPDISYSPDWFVLTNNTAMSPTATPTNSGGAIPSGTLDSNGDVGKFTSIAIDSNGFKHISYRDSTNGDLKYATDKTGSWVAISVDTTGNAGVHTSIAIDSTDGVHISYIDYTNFYLKYASCSSGCTTASNWDDVSVDTTVNVRYSTSIAIDSTDGVHISYFDNTNQDLKYATCSSGCTTASNWDDVSVDTTGDVGGHTSIAIDSNDGLHISYFDDTNNDLKYATCSSSCTTASNWNNVSVDTTGDVGYYTSIAIDSNDGVHISYYDNTNGDLKYATCSSSCTTASNWDDVSVDTTHNVGGYTSIAIDSTDGVHISHRYHNYGDLKYASCSSGCTTASNWDDVSVDTTGDVGYYTSIAIDSNDGVHISYYDDTNDDLKYIALDSSSNIYGYSISPDLPAGLSFNTSTGEISGTPTELSTNTTYTITVRNSGGVNTTTITIVVNDQVPNALGYTPENMTLEKGTTMTTNTPSVSGGAVTSWEISPSLPSGLSFGSTNGSIWGTPSVLQTTAATYTIWANNSGGSASAQVNITINDQIASISYSSPVEISNNRPLSSTITPTNTGGAVTSWEISPSLPTGLTFGTTNGSIWGTPENVTSNVTYTIWANNSGGSASATLTLNINWTLTPSPAGAYITRNASIGTDITWEWDYDPLEAIYAGLVTGAWNTCAIDDNGDVFCWGRNGNGQIGNGQSGTSACGTSGHKCKDIPTRTDDLGSDVVALAFGHQHACGLTDAGVVKCWGRNNNGQIGTSGGDVDSPFTVSLGSGRTATSIYAGGYSTCAILDDGSTKCWGHNSDGQLGIGSTSNTNTPTTIGSLGSGRTAVSLAMAMTTVCALLDDGSVKCWGDDAYGQLGNGGTNVDINSPPASAINLGSGRTAKSITAGQYHFCAILDDNSIKCWGQGWDGKLGTGSTSDRSTPTAVSGSFASGRYAVYLDAGYEHTCAILDNGDLTCWGSDAKGQLGNGAGSSWDVSSLSSSVISLGSGRTAISVSAGGTHTCAQLDNGQLKCWGNRADGQVGDNGGFNNPSDRTSPSTVSNNNYGGNTYADTGVFPSAAVSGATCAISPALPTGMSLTSGTCAITGTPTVTAFNTTYTVWANISGQSFSGQVWLEVGLNVPILSYSPTSYLFVNGTAITEVQPINTGGEISGFEISPALPNGLSIGSTNGTIWGTPTVASSLTSYTIWGNNSAGSSSTTISIKVETTPTSLAYDTENMNLTKGLAMTTNTATVGGGTPTSWEISPALPSGFSFSSTTGDISGTPTVLQTSAVTYTVWANNTAGSVNTSLNITINDVAPNSVVYSPENMTLSNNTAMTTNTPSAGGGTVTSWEISPALPSGLSFGSTNGSIWGTPTVEQSSTTYTVWANNSGGSSSGSINITIGPEAPGDFEYIPENNTLTNNTYVHLEPDFINITTGNGSSWSTPAGTFMPWASFCLHHVYNGTLYTAATNGSGTSPEFYGYGLDNETAWVINSTLSSPGCNAVSYGMAGSGWEKSFSMVHGTSLYFESSQTGWGAGLFGYGLENGTLWRQSSSGFEITSGFTYAFDDVLYFGAYHNSSVGHAMHAHNLSNGTTWLVIDASSGSTITTYAGTSGHGVGKVGDVFLYQTRFATNGNWYWRLWAFNTSNGSAWEISSNAISSGGPVLDGVLYYSRGTYSLSRSLFAYNVSNETSWLVHSRSDVGSIRELGGVLYYATASTTHSGDSLWAHNPDNETTWEIGGSDAEIRGSFLVAGGTLFYRVYTGSSEKELWAYDPSNTTAWQIPNATTNDDTFTSLGNTVYFTSDSTSNSGEHDLWAYNTANETTWHVTNISASNWGFGSNSWPSSNPTSTSLVFAGDTLYIREGGGMRSHQPASINYQTNTGGNVTTWAINASLPTGLTFSTTNGSIYGTPTELWTQTSYMVWANNSGGSSVAYLNITVVDELPTLSYSPSTLVLTINTSSTDLPLNATLTGSGTITSWAISPALPSGLSFGTGNGTIWGTPTSLMTLKTFTIWANNSGGSSFATVNITVNDEAPDISYNPDWFVLTNNTAMSPTATPTNSGGAVPTNLLVSTGNVGEHNSIAIDSNGYKHISFFDATNADLKYTTDKSGSWVTISIETTGYIGQFTSIAIDSNDAIHISYYDGTNYNLKYATCSSNCTNASNWDKVAVDTSGGVGWDTSIAIDSNDAIHISYYDTTNDDLKYATCSSNCTNASNWDNITIDTSADVGRFSSIAIDSNDGIHVSYRYSSYQTHSLKYAECSSSCTSTSSWSNRTLNTYGGYGYSQRTSMAIDSNDRLYIAIYGSYFSSTGLMIHSCASSCTTSSWSFTFVDGVASNYGTSFMLGEIAVDSNDGLHVAYMLDSSPYELKHAYCTSSCTSASSWTKNTLDSSSIAFGHISLAIDSNDVAHIVYEDTNDDLRHLSVDSSSNIYGYSISPDLPAGLSFNTSTGEISGTPTELSTNTTYTITARNSGGVNTTTITIEVIDNVPTVSYSPENLTLTNNTASSNLPLAPTITGSGAITSWALNNTSLPSGISFSTSTGTFSGTPTELWPTQAYMVWANNSGGSTVAYLNITVVDVLPTVSLSPSNLTLYNNTVSTDLPLVPTVIGPGEITLWGLNDSLPSGLSFDNNNGTIWGTPTELWPTTAYRLAALNSGGTTYAYFNLTVLHQAPMFTYPSYNLTLVNNTAMSSLTTTSTGGDITSWEVSPSLPSGLSFGTLYGTVWGTPTVVQNTTMYTVWGNNSGGSHAVYINITIYDPAVTLEYTPENLTLTRGVAMNDLHPSYSGIVANWTIEPALPAGLSFTNGVIAGTPTVNMTTTMFTVWANNSGGSSNHTVNITVLEPVVVLDYNPENLTLIRGVQMATLFPSVSGGNVSNWSISPDLPASLNFSDGVISGTPTVNMTTSMFTVWANTSGGATSHTLNITVLEPSGNLSYSPENITLTRGVAMSDLHPTYSGGTVENWSIHPALPAGLNFSNGIISGTPTVNLTTSMFTIYANNSGGSAAATINLTILEPVVDLSYSPANLTLMRGTTMMPLLPTVSGGNVSEWALVGVLPEGLNFSNGVFSGTPLVNMTQTQYLVYANTTGGSATAWVNITVLEPAVDLSYNPYNITLTRNVTMNPLSPTVSGGNVSNWSIFPELPAGLNFTNGTISGTPEVNMTTTMFTVWANTSGGAASTTVNITIVEPVVDFLYSPNAIVLTRNETMNATSPVFGGDAMADEWGISPALPEGLNFTNGTISGTPLVNLTATVFMVYANNSGGSAVAYLTITVLEPVATVVYVPENITLTRGEDNASIVPILGGGMVASWSISPALPDGMVFDNGSITGVPLVNMTNTTFTVMALNSGGMAFVFLNLTVVEPVAVLAFNESFVVTRGEDLLNQTVNNTGGMVATWEIEPALPAGVSIFNGWLYGVSQVNLTETVFTLWANNSGGSVNITFTLEVLEPVANVTYVDDEITLVNGINRALIIPTISGGVADSWAIEPALPAGLTFVNGYIVGIPTSVLNSTTFTVWANNSGGSTNATFTLLVEYPTFYARYPVTRIVLDVNETMPELAPLYYFGDTRNPVWAISPGLPTGLNFSNGVIAGTPTVASNETNYTITVTGDMAPVEFFLIIEVREKANLTVPSVRNETQDEVFNLPEPEVTDDSFDMYWICPPLLFLVLLLLAAAINNFLALAAKDDDEEEEPEDEAKDDG